MGEAGRQGICPRRLRIGGPSPSTLWLPGKYVQGAGAIHHIGEHAARLGDRALLLGGPTALSVSREAVAASLERGGVPTVEAQFGGECTLREIERLAARALRERVTVIIGAGGGKALDTAKGVAHHIAAACVVVPTIASTDAPCSGVMGLYTEDHVPLTTGIDLRRNPDLVLVDSSIIVRSPLRYTVAGMGDALATAFEAEDCAQSGAPNIHGGSATQTALACARLCYDLVVTHGVDAARAIEAGRLTDDVEKVLEATVLLSGVGFENCGLSVAHALWVSFGTVPEFRSLDVYHGEAVAFFTLVQVVLENRRDVVTDVFRFCRTVGLPVSLGDIGLHEPPEQLLMRGVAAAFVPGGYIYNVPTAVNEEMVVEAMREADAIGQALSA